MGAEAFSDASGHSQGGGRSADRFGLVAMGSIHTRKWQRHVRFVLAYETNRRIN